MFDRLRFKRRKQERREHYEEKKKDWFLISQENLANVGNNS